MQQLAAADPFAPLAGDVGGQAVLLPALGRPDGAGGEGGLGLAGEQGVGDLVEAEQVGDDAGDVAHLPQRVCGGARRRRFQNRSLHQPRTEADDGVQAAPGRAVRSGEGQPRPGPQGPGQVDVARVAAEELVPAGAGQGDGHARVARGPADEVGVDAVERGLVDGGEGVGQLLPEALLGEHDARVTALDGIRHLASVAGLVVGGHVEAHREGVHGVRRGLAGQGRDRARVDTAGQEDAQGDVGDELHPDRVGELLAQLGDGRPAVGGRRHLPVPAHARGGSVGGEPGSAARVMMVAAGRSWTPSTMVAGPTTKPWKRYDATAAGSSRRGTTPLASRARTSEANRTTSSPESGSAHGGPVQGLDAHLVAHEVNGPRARVPEGQREDPAKAPRRRRCPSACRP